MIAVNERDRHEEVWLLLPWLANGRLQAEEREMAEEHVRACADCEQELARQNLMCTALTEPDRVVYAPGPSFRKLMERIDRDAASDASPVEEALPAKASSARPLTARLGRVSLWRPPGLAWAASFILLFGITGLTVTAHRWSAPNYETRTAAAAVNPNVLHIALDRSIPIGEVEELLRTSGARIAEGPDSTGYLGVTPAAVVPGQTPEASAIRQLRELSTRLRKDPRVLWVEPRAEEGEGTPADRAPDVREH
jgi:hypothetical protein